MLTLRDLQAGFVSDMRGDRLASLDGVICNGKFSANALMQVYRNNHNISLTEALRAVYTSVDGLVGKGFFDYAAHQFIREYPSRCGNLHDFGRMFPAFLQAMPKTGHLPYLHDIAELDWLYHEVFHEAEGDDLAGEKLQAVKPDDYGRLLFELTPAVRFFYTPFSIVDIWQAGKNLPTETSGDELRYEQGPEYLMVHRSSFEVSVLSLPSAEYHFFQALGRGQTLESA
ncbi:MAG: putative DNA-binding domain-containing protein, partial [Gammaproteobacteria bacterium]|nr:putative DNA-binding domain-containing protein [Gammaproteobacteria bacterium]